MKLTAFTALCVMGNAAFAFNKRLTITTGLTLRETCYGTCVECYGAGMVSCGDSYCYDPSAGESCCDDGSYCAAGKTCTNIEGGCCNTGQSLQDCAASLGVPVPTSSATPSPTATDTGDSSGDDSSDTDTSEDVGNWISHHKGIVAGAATGLVVLILLLVALGIYRRRRARILYVSSSNAPPTASFVYQTDDVGRGRYTTK